MKLAIFGGELSQFGGPLAQIWFAYPFAAPLSTKYSKKCFVKFPKRNETSESPQKPNPNPKKIKK